MYYLGIDIGSSATKLIAIDENKQIAGRSVVQLGTGTSGVATAVESLYASSGLKAEDIAMTVATGYGRLTCDGADLQISEIPVTQRVSTACSPRCVPLLISAARIPRPFKSVNGAPSSSLS